MISIIIPIFNQAGKLRAVLESLAAQSYQDFEVIIVNDGSKDNPEDVFIKYLRERQPKLSCLFLNQDNQGAPAARNRGFRSAKGEYLFFCDADAVLAPEALAKLLSALEANSQASYAYSSFRWGRKLFRVGQCDPDRLRQGPCIHTMALIRRQDFPASGWDESIKKLQDWDLWLSMLDAGKIGVFVPEVLFQVSPGGHISSWLPSFAYRFLPFLPAARKYREAVSLVKQKHGLEGQ